MDIAGYIVLAVSLALILAVNIHTNTMVGKSAGDTFVTRKQLDRLEERGVVNREDQARNFRRLGSKLDSMKAPSIYEPLTTSPLLGKNVIATGETEDGKAVRVEGVLGVLEHRRETHGWHAMNVLNAEVAGVEVSRATVKLAEEKEA